MKRVVVVALVVACSCARPSRLIKATIHYGEISRSAVGELAAAPGLVSEICVQRAALEYMATRVVSPARVAATFAEFYRDAKAPINLPGAPTVTWKQHCDAYRVADQAFMLGLASVGDYGAALEALAREDESYESNSADLAANAASGIALISPRAAPYKEALSGIGAPLGLIADAVKQKWKSKQLRKLIARTDTPLHEVVAKLDAYVHVVQKRQLADLREALVVLRDELELVREAQAPAQPPRPPVIYKIDLVSAMWIDIELTDRIGRIDRKLKALVEVLDGLAAAHTELNKGWDAGEEIGLATLEAIGKLGKAIHEDVGAFRTPEVAP